MSDPTLQSTHFIDTDHPRIRAFVEEHAGGGSEEERAVRLTHAVRDAVAYDMWSFGLDEKDFIASNVLDASSAFCVPKAVALAAVARAAGIPARIGFADVKNHLTNPRIDEMMEGDDTFRWHAYTSLFVGGKWVKATPAFDMTLCQRHGVKPLVFNGRDDSIFHEFDETGRKHMEYVRFIGEFDDMPFEEFSTEMRRAYPRMLRELGELRERRAARKAG
ncbi:MAG: transglutaminase family protein [Mesorhizobium sp.]